MRPGDLHSFHEQTQMLIRRKGNEPLNDHDYEEARRMLLANLESVIEFADIDGDTPDERLARARIDKSYFARTYLPHYYSTGFSPLSKEEKKRIKKEYKVPKHERKIFEALSTRNQPVVLTAFRAAGKSTDVMVEEIHSALFGNLKFIVHVMDSHDKAQMYTLRILTELQHNKRLLHDFGQTVRKDAGMGDFELSDPLTGEHRSRIYAMGIKMSIRGLISGNTRPDGVFCEDLQNSDTAINPKLTKKLLNKLLADIRFCFDQIRNQWAFVVVGNIICSGSLIDTLIKYAKTWLKVIIPVEYHDKAGRRVAVWKEVFPLSRCDEMRADTEIGGDAVYRREMLCQGIELEGEFAEDWFRHHDGKTIYGLNYKNMIMQIDPSFADHGDMKAMVIGPLHKITKEEYLDPKKPRSKDMMKRDLGVGEFCVAVDVFCRKCSIDKLVETMYDWHKKYNPKEIRCDGTASQKYFMRRVLAEYESQPQYYRLPVKYTEQQENKDEKISDLEPLISGGGLLLPPRSSKDVEEVIIQFTRFGNTGIKKDGADVIAEWTKSLGKRGRRGKAKVTLM